MRHPCWRFPAVGGIIAQATKFCKPSLNKFGKACQIARFARFGDGGNPCNASKMMRYLWRKMEKRVWKIWEDRFARCMGEIDIFART